MAHEETAKIPVQVWLTPELYARLQREPKRQRSRIVRNALYAYYGERDKIEDNSLAALRVELRELAQTMRERLDALEMRLRSGSTVAVPTGGTQTDASLLAEIEAGLGSVGD